MPNLMITTRCNFNCSYCFGADVMTGGTNPSDMTVDTFRDLVNWIAMSRQPDLRIHLMGGEPTLHPDFLAMVDILQKERFGLSVFSNCATLASNEYTERLKDQAIDWVVNVNPPNSRTNQQDECLRRSLKSLGTKATITLNMVPQPQAYDWTLDLIAQYRLAPRIKIGFALPTLQQTNEHLADEDYPEVAERVVAFGQLCSKFGVRLEYECGVPWCAFTPEQLGKLWACGSTFFSSCGSRLDALPDGRVIYCLPLADLCSPSYKDFPSYQHAKRWYEDTLSKYRPMGTKAACPGCHLMIQGPCRGGCLARTIAGAHNFGKEISFGRATV